MAPTLQIGPFLMFLHQIKLDIHTEPVGLLCTSDQPVTHAAAYTTHNKHTNICAVSGIRVHSEQTVQNYVSDRTVAGIGTLLHYTDMNQFFTYDLICTTWRQFESCWLFADLKKRVFFGVGFNFAHLNKLSRQIRAQTSTKYVRMLVVTVSLVCLDQCFSTAGPRPGTGPWHQLYRAARICHFIFLRIFQE
jgi:hypothetical protein